MILAKPLPVSQAGVLSSLSDGVAPELGKAMGFPLAAASRWRRAVSWPCGVTVSTLDSESSDRGSNPREASLRFGFAQQQTFDAQSEPVDSCFFLAGLCVRGPAWEKWSHAGLNRGPYGY